MTRDELRDLIITAKRVIAKLEYYWRYAKDTNIEKLETISSPCDACEKLDKKD